MENREYITIMFPAGADTKELKEKIHNMDFGNNGFAFDEIKPNDLILKETIEECKCGEPIDGNDITIFDVENKEVRANYTCFQCEKETTFISKVEWKEADENGK